MAFDRHEILFNHYKKQILEEFVWDRIEQEARKNCFVDEEGNIIASCWIGTVFALYPSGKYWTWWACSNVSRSERAKDEAYAFALEEVLDDKGFFQTCGEGDSTDVFFQKVIDKDEVISFITIEDEERANKLNQ